MIHYSRRAHRDAIAGAPALEVHQLCVRYPGARRLALKGVDLTVPVGARAALVGHNGAGKSSLLKAAAGLLPIASGSLLLYGLAPGACHHRVAYLPQRGEIDWHFPISLRRLVLTGRYVHLGWLKMPTVADWKVTDAMLDELGLLELRNRQIGELSGGQQQRALIARALAQEAELLLLDEPTSALDAETRDVIGAVLAGLRARGKTIIAATHDLTRLQTDFDQVLMLADGREAVAA